MGRWGIWLAGLATLLLAVAAIGILASSLFGKDDSEDPSLSVGDAPSISSERASTIVKHWIAGGTEAGYVEELLDALECSGYYKGSDVWEVKCRLPWVPLEGYLFRLYEGSGEVKPETEATLAFVQLLREWGHVSGQ